MTASARPRIALVAGEASGDMLGAGLIARLQEHYPQAEFAGIGGDNMREAGCKTWFDANELAIFGLTEVLRHLPRLLSLRKQLRKQLLDWKPDVFIGIDAPDFNLSLERWMKQRGFRTVHYVSPSIWAWRQKRAEKIGSSADLVLCLFPMEPPIYAKHGVTAQFVGHPMADDMPLKPDHQVARCILNLPANDPTLAILSGSRLGEVSRLAPVFLAAAQQLLQRIPNLQIVIPSANAACHHLLEKLLAQSSLPTAQLHLLNKQARASLWAADAAVLASGTATLETMLAKCPMVVGYKVAPFTAFIARSLNLLKVTRFALPNILAGKDLAPEFMQEDCTAENIAKALYHWLTNQTAIAELQPEYLRLHQLLRQDASACAAKAITQLIQQPAPPAA